MEINAYTMSEALKSAKSAFEACAGMMKPHRVGKSLSHRILNGIISPGLTVETYEASVNAAHEFLFGNEAEKMRGLASQLATAGNTEATDTILKAAQMNLKQAAYPSAIRPWLVNRLINDYIATFKKAAGLEASTHEGVVELRPRRARQL